MEKIDTSKIQDLGSSISKNKNDAVAFWQNQGPDYIDYYIEMFLTKNETYDSSIIKVLSSFGDSGIEIIFSRFFMCFENESIPFLVDFDFESFAKLSVDSVQGVHIINSLIKYFYKNSNVELIIKNTFDKKFNNNAYKKFFAGIIERAIKKKKFNSSNIERINQALYPSLEDREKQTVNKNRIADEMLQNYFQLVADFVDYRNIADVESLDKKKFHEVMDACYKLTSFDTRTCLRYLNANISVEERNKTFEDYKDILIGYNESESKWEQKYVDLLLHMEFDSDVYFDFGSTLQNLPYRLENPNRYYIDEEKIEKYVEKNMIRTIQGELIDQKDHYKNCTGNYSIKLDGHFWESKAYNGLSVLLLLQNPTGLNLLEKALKYVLEEDIPVGKGFLYNAAVYLESYKKSFRSQCEERQDINKRKRELGIKWEKLCLAILKEKHKNVEYQYRLSEDAIADIGVNLHTGSMEKVPVFDVIFECKKSFYFIHQLSEDKKIDLRHDSVVNKYQGHCDKLVFFILDNTSLDILHEKSVSIVFATELLQEENISDQFKSRVSALISESVQLEQMLETFLDNDLSVKLNGLGSQGMKENDTEYLEMVDLLHRIRPVD